jgi:glycosyltransferase involved in cell wall biosynthesis
MNAQSLQPAIGYLVRSYPRLSQTFILHEIVALEELGLRLRIFAVTNPQEPVVQDEVARVKAPVHYLEKALRRARSVVLSEHLSVLLKSPKGYLKALAYVVRQREIDKGYTSASRFECFLQAVYLARRLFMEQKPAGGEIRHLHAHFAHDPTLIAFLTHILTGIPYSFTAHARDLYQIPEQAIVDRVERASSVVTCSAANFDYLRRVLPEQLLSKVSLIYHGVDLRKFAPTSLTEVMRDEGGGMRAAAKAYPSEETRIPLILSAGRLVEKKGFPDLLRALAMLKEAGHRFRCEIYGDGPMRKELLAVTGRLGLSGEVELVGELRQQELVPALQGADIFALAPFITEDGDRDGVPNVLVEAMACGLPVVSTEVGGVPELVKHGCNGLLARPHDARGIADALALLIEDKELRHQLGEAARCTVIEHFNLRSAANRLAALFGFAPEGSYAN